MAPLKTLLALPLAQFAILVVLPLLSLAVTTVADTTADNLFMIPAGSQILSITVDITTAYAGTTGNTITIKCGSTTLGTVGGATTTPLAVGRATFTITDASIGTFVNIGYN